MNPKVTIGLRLSTEPCALSASGEHDFYIVVNARILTTPQEDSSVTLGTFLTPLMGLSNRSYTNIIRVDSSITANDAPHPRILRLMPQGYGQRDSSSDAGNTSSSFTTSKIIEVWPQSWPQYVPPLPNLRSQREFVTVPPRGDGVLAVKFKVPREKIEAAKVNPGEKYRISLTDKYLGTDWWGFGNFQGRRLRFWEPADRRSTMEEMEQYYRSIEWWDYANNINEGEGEWECGEQSDNLAFVVEDNGDAGVVEFEVVK